MCGIVGKLQFNGNNIDNFNEIEKMLSIQRHRGPNDEGMCLISSLNNEIIDVSHNKNHNNKVTFNGVIGFSRLSILDKSYNGHQPMLSHDKKVLLAFNGEIYNAFDFKDELISKGYSFNGNSDTEIILSLYLEYGFDRMIRLLNGMFAIVIVDMRLKKIFFARDRFGIKPLYYIKNKEKIAFASEIKSIIQLKHDFDFELNLDAYYEYIVFRSALNSSMIKGVNQFKPGHYVEFNFDGSFYEHKYFNLNSYKRYSTSDISFEETKVEVEKRFTKAVKRQLLSDVPIGCQLSGGIDSSLVTYIAHKNNSNLNDTISITFEDARFSEEKYIDYANSIIGTKEHKYTFDSKMYQQYLEQGVWGQESIITHPNSLCLLQLTKCAKKQVTVLLSGEGSDEIFAGYPRFCNIKASNIAEYINLAVRATNTIPKELCNTILPELPFDNYIQKRIDMYDSYQGSILNKQICYEIQTYMPELLLRQDKMSMSNSIENRVPFLDHELVDFALTIPEEYLVPTNNPKDTKHILKSISVDIFGQEFTYRKKMGFSTPINHFIGTNWFKDYFYNLIIPEMKKRTFINSNKVISIYEKLDKITYPEVELFWRILTGEIFIQMFCENVFRT